MPELAEHTPTKAEHPGISTKRIIIPAVIVILFLHAAIVLNTLRINRAGLDVSQTMQLNFTYAQTLKTYESLSNATADKARLYAGTGNESYLAEYCQIAEQLTEQEAAVNKLLQSYPDNPASEYIEGAVKAVRAAAHTEAIALRHYAQSRHISLIRYPFLAETEVGSEDRELDATKLLTSEGYQQSRALLNSYMDSALEHVSKYTSQAIAERSVSLSAYRALQWIITLVIIVILSVMCVLLFSHLLTPLELSVEHIQHGEALPDERGFAEFRRLAHSYNELLHHRKMMETYLRQQSQTDALTQLRNRLAFQDYISGLSWTQAHSAVTVFSLDVNGLKEANDKHGHTYGDDLLRRCAACIQEAFGGGDDRQCFRFGGDEFAAFWVDVPPEEIQTAMERFAKVQEEQGVSISAGYAHADDLGETTVEELFERADKFMYEEKAKHYKRTSAAPRGGKDAE